jgi:hypothetical protein
MAQEQGSARIMSRIKEQFIPIRLSMLESPAYRTMSLMARRFLNAVERENLRHGGKDNGKLIVPGKTLKEYCLTASTRMINEAKLEAEALGFLHFKRGSAANGPKRAPNEYGLTYLPGHNGHNGGPPTDEWAEIKTIEEAKQRIEEAKYKRGQSDWFKAANVIGFPRKKGTAP